MNNEQQLHDNFLTEIAKHLDYKPDSANYDVYNLIAELIIAEGGDDDFPASKYNRFDIAFEFSKHITEYDIEDYDNDSDMTDVYDRIKPLVLASLK